MRHRFGGACDGASRVDRSSGCRPGARRSLIDRRPAAARQRSHDAEVSSAVGHADRGTRRRRPDTRRSPRRRRSPLRGRDRRRRVLALEPCAYSAQRRRPAPDSASRRGDQRAKRAQNRADPLFGGHLPERDEHDRVVGNGERPSHASARVVAAPGHRRRTPIRIISTAAPGYSSRRSPRPAGCGRRPVRAVLITTRSIDQK